MIVVCPKHGIEYENLIMAGGVRLTGRCPRCNAEDFEREKQEEGRKARERCIAEFRGMNIEPEYYQASLVTFIATTPELKKNAGLVQNLIDGQVRELVMVGGNGTGKTHLAVAAVKALRGKIYSMYEISTRIRSTYAPRAAETELEVVDELARTPILVIDEIGRTKGSGAELDWLSYIIDKRHVRNLPTILISNKHLRRDCPSPTGCPNCFDNYIGEDVMSRLFESGLVLHFTGNDYRKTSKSPARLPEKSTIR